MAWGVGGMGAGVGVEGGPGDACEWVKKEHSQVAHDQPGGDHGSPHLRERRLKTD